MRIQHNIAALNSYRQLGGNNNAVAKNLEKLSSGYKINRAGDDAAGLAISEKMRAQITGLETAQKNAQDGISLVQTAEGALTEVHSMLNRMVELATQSSNGTYSDTIDRENLQAEVDSLRDEINRISESTNFNGINLLDGSLGGPKTTKTPGDVLTTSAMIGGDAVAATATTGNKFTIDTTGLTGTGDGYVTVSYTDEKGEAKTKDIKFTMNADAKESAKSLAEAINTDKDLKNVFKASVDETTGKLTIEGKQTGADAKSKITGIQSRPLTPTGGAKDTAATTEGANAVYQEINLTTDKHLEFTLNDGTTFKVEYDKTLAATSGTGNSDTSGGTNKFKNLAGLNELLATKGLKAEVKVGTGGTAVTPGTPPTGGAALASDKLTDLKIVDLNTGFDAQLKSVKHGNTAAAITTEINKATDVVGAHFSFDGIEGVREGEERSFLLNYQKANGDAAVVKFAFKGGKDDVETRNNLETALQEALNADEEFKKAIGDVDVTVDPADGKITIASQEQGRNGAATIGDITVGAGAKDITTSVEGRNAVFNDFTLAATNKLRITKKDGTTFDLEYAATASAGANKFNSLAELNTALDAQGLKAIVADAALTGGNIKGLTIVDKDTGMDAGVKIEKVVPSTTGSADTVTTVGEKVSAAKAKYNLNGFEGDIAKGETRQFKLNYKKVDGTAASVDFSVKGGRTAEETKENLQKALQEALEKDADFKAAMGDVKVSVDATSGAISIESKLEGKKGAETVLGITTGANPADGKDFSKTESATGNDAHLNLKDAFDGDGNNDFADGDTVTIGKNTYTFKAGADGADGKTFGDLDSLIAAAEQNGVHLEDTSGWDDGSSLVAKSAATFTFDFDGRIGSDVLGASIDFAGSVFKFVEVGSNPKAEEGVSFIEIAKDADAEQIAEALQKAIDGVKSTKNAENPEDGEVTWTSEATENKSGKKTVVTLTSNDMGKIDMPKTKFKDFGINLQVGDTNDDFQKVRVSVDSMDAASLGIDTVDITTQNKAGDSIKMIKDAINTVSSQRGKLGAVQNRLEHTINNLGVTTENITAAESRIRDTDMAKEMMAYTKNNILVQSAQAMLAQANTLPQGVLQLLG